MRRRPLLVTVVAVAVLVVAGAGGVVRSQAASRTVSMSGSALPAVSGAAVVGAPSATTQISSIVFLAPRHSSLLDHTAARTRAHGLSQATIQKLFVPPGAQIAELEAYLRSAGLRVAGRHLLAIDVVGSVSAQERAFGVQLRIYRGRNGRYFRAPSGPTRLPARIAPLVQAVGGLDTSLRLEPAVAGHTRVASSSSTPDCSGAGTSQNRFNDLSTAYDYGSLPDGTGESIALLEYSAYHTSDITNFTTCMGITDTQTNEAVDGGNTTVSDNVEVTLDIEVAMAAAPGAHIYVYKAPNNVADGIDAINQMVSDQGTTHVHVVSDSWGLCEPLMPPSLLAAENQALQMAAAAGMSVYVASGDSGSSDCLPQTGSKSLYVDDPSAQPFATAVGGTTVNSFSPSLSETTWNNADGASGGGQSSWWPAPSWQSGFSKTLAPTTCHYAAGQCRQTPDLALDADPETGYAIYTTTGSAPGWYWIGGTSAAAPLMAAITARANAYSLANNGLRLGFASPFLYAEAGTADGVFNDVTTGNNNVVGGTSYAAGTGFDLATGLGSINAQNMTDALAADGYSGPPQAPAPRTSTLTATGPASPKTITYGQAVDFTGTLTDTNGPITGTPVYLSTPAGVFRTVTDGSGHYSLVLSTALNRNVTWTVSYLGSDADAPSNSASGHVYVIPKLTVAASLPISSGHYVAHVGKAFTVSGTSTPNLHGADVTVQYRVSGSSTWHGLKATAVTTSGKYSTSISFGRRETVYLRWHYSGGTTRKWMFANSPQSRAVVVS